MSNKVNFLVFGEDMNDCICITNLIRTISKSSKDVFASPRRRPLVLNRTALRSGKRRKMSEEIAHLVRFEERKANGLIIPVLHRDCDAVEPAHVEEQKALREDLKAAGMAVAVVAAPAWELETWWMLFPDALSATRSCWNRVNYGSRNVGMIPRSKEKLKRDLRPKGRNPFPDYRETDGIKISRNITLEILKKYKDQTQSASFLSFVNQVELAIGG